MKKLIRFSLLTALVLLFAAGCGNPFAPENLSGGETEETPNVEISMNIPDYVRALSGGRAIHADVDSFLVSATRDGSTEVVANLSINDTGEEWISGGPQGKLVHFEFTLDPGYYEEIQVEQIDAEGNQLAVGSAFDVYITPNVNDIHVSCTPWDYTEMTLETPVTETTNTMDFFKITAEYPAEYGVRLFWEEESTVPSLYVYDGEGRLITHEDNEMEERDEATGAFISAEITIGNYLEAGDYYFGIVNRDNETPFSYSLEAFEHEPLDWEPTTDFSQPFDISGNELIIEGNFYSGLYSLDAGISSVNGLVMGTPSIDETNDYWSVTFDTTGLRDGFHLIQALPNGEEKEQRMELVELVNSGFVPTNGQTVDISFNLPGGENLSTEQPLMIALTNSALEGMGHLLGIIETGTGTVNISFENVPSGLYNVMAFAEKDGELGPTGPDEYQFMSLFNVETAPVTLEPLDFSYGGENDELEYNDDAANAQEMFTGDYWGYLNIVQGDVDFFKIYLSEGELLGINLYGNDDSWGLFPQVILYDTDGMTELDWNNTSHDDAWVDLQFIAPAAGTYYFTVQSDDSDTGTYGHYDLSVETRLQTERTSASFSVLNFQNLPDGDYYITGEFDYRPWENIEERRFTVTGGSGMLENTAYCSMDPKGDFYFSLVSASDEQPWYPDNVGNGEDMHDFKVFIPMDNAIHAIELDGTTDEIVPNLDGQSTGFAQTITDFTVNGTLSLAQLPPMASDLYIWAATPGTNEIHTEFLSLNGTETEKAFSLSGLIHRGIMNSVPVIVGALIDEDGDQEWDEGELMMLDQFIGEHFYGEASFDGADWTLTSTPAGTLSRDLVGINPKTGSSSVEGLVEVQFNFSGFTDWADTNIAVAGKNYRNEYNEERTWDNQAFRTFVDGSGNASVTAWVKLEEGLNYEWNRFYADEGDDMCFVVVDPDGPNGGWNHILFSAEDVMAGIEDLYNGFILDLSAEGIGPDDVISLTINSADLN